MPDNCQDTRMPTHFPDNLNYLYSTEQVRGLEAALIAQGLSGYRLMQRAASACFAALREQWPEASVITVLAGHGNNAGDGYLIATKALQAGFNVKLVYARAPNTLKGDAAVAVTAAIAAGVPCVPWQGAAQLSGIVVDALLGIGCVGEVREPYLSIIEALNQSALPVLAVDVPSGLCANTGQVNGVAVIADLTMTLVASKVGLAMPEAAAYTGEVGLASLREDSERALKTEPCVLRLSEADLPLIKPRTRTTHKGQCGHVLVVAGDRGTGGAGLLSAEMALRAGAGLVSLATRAEHTSAALVRVPEVMSQAVASANQLLELMTRASVLVVGPGLGQNAWGRSLLSAAATGAQAQVWDADALNLLAEGVIGLPAHAVLTPHPGEAARLLGCSSAQVQADRVAALKALVTKYQVCVVLKGAGTLIGAPDMPVVLCDRGHPVMAGAGLGDVLSGLLGALLAQGLSPYQAAKLGVWLHACAGELLAEQGRGLAAHDLIAPIRGLLEEVAHV